MSTATYPKNLKGQPAWLLCASVRTRKATRKESTASRNTVNSPIGIEAGSCCRWETLACYLKIEHRY